MRKYTLKKKDLLKSLIGSLESIYSSRAYFVQYG